MKLSKIHFNAYKSLVSEKLYVVDNCIGFVGINESGKSNLLQAISVLSKDNALKASDSPKMVKGTDPNLVYEFIPTEQVKNEIGELIIGWFPEAIDKTENVFSLDDCRIQYDVRFNLKEKKEERCFKITNITKIPKKYRYLKYEANSENLIWKRGDVFLKLSEVFITTDAELKANKILYEKLSRFYEMSNQLNELNKQTTESVTVDASSSKENITEEQVSVSPEKKKLIESIEKIKGELGELVNTVSVQEKVEKRNFNTRENENLEKNNKELLSIQENLGKKESLDPNQQIQLKNAKDTIAANTKKIIQLTNLNLTLDREIKSLEEPFEEKYTDDLAVLSSRIGDYLGDMLTTLLPRVVFWQYSDDYILQGETEFNIITDAKNIDEISRPLINMFRIGLGTTNLQELKNVIQEIQTNPSERSRYQARLNNEINSYLDIVWADYDQKISITLEQERIRVLFFDPQCKDASYYEMNERSQGCQTFISFLLTIGAEAKKGVITNTVLLLDEPETHLHPSGVRFMLKELVAASKQSNYVFFATHSIFMIDKNKYNRYIILKKIQERTTITPSSKERVGFFMQEEVLYGSLNINITEEFINTKKYNFVFEGEGDAVLFSHCYEKCFTKNEQPFDIKETSFYQGGKCTDIRKYFSHTPIQLGSTWVLILDNDIPANELKKFFESKYGNFIGKYIYIFQYSLSGIVVDKPFELEDMLPNEIIEEITSSIKDEFFEAGTIIPGRTDFELFKDYLNALLNISKNSNELQGCYKQQLNISLNKLTKELKSKENINAKLPSYKEWVESVIAKINGNTKQ